MAPTNSSKPNNTRWHAAVDHMLAMGFEYGVISTQLMRLLEVYGQDGWLFIESDSYRVLIEAILEAQTNEILQELAEGDDADAEAGQSSELQDSAVTQPTRTEVNTRGLNTAALGTNSSVQESKSDYGYRRPVSPWMYVYGGGAAESSEEEAERPSKRIALEGNTYWEAQSENYSYCPISPAYVNDEDIIEQPTDAEGWQVDGEPPPCRPTRRLHCLAWIYDEDDADNENH